MLEAAEVCPFCVNFTVCILISIELSWIAEVLSNTSISMVSSPAKVNCVKSGLSFSEVNIILNSLVRSGKIKIENKIILIYFFM